MRLLLDEHLPPAVAEALRRAGSDVVAVVERPDLRGSSDLRLIEIALDEGRVFVTLDIGDHLKILHGLVRVGQPHPGLVLISGRTWLPSRATIGPLIRALERLLAMDLPPGSMRGRVVWLPRDLDPSG